MPTPAWATPNHATASTVASAAAFNSHENDLLYLKDRVDNPPRCRLNHNTTQSITTGTDTAVAFNAEFQDSAALHDTVTNNSRITIPTGEGGQYLFTASVEFASSPTGQRKIMFRIGGSSDVALVTVDAAAGSQPTRLTTVYQYQASAGDYLEVFVSQNSGGSINLAATPLFSATRLD
jgi:hypothetical protein